MRLAAGAATISFHREIASCLAEVDMVCREIRSLLLNNGLEEAGFAVE